MGTNVYVIKELEWYWMNSVLTDEDLQFQELYGAYMNVFWSEPHCPLQLQKGFCFHFCVRALSAEAMCTGREWIRPGSRAPLSSVTAGTTCLFASCLMKALHNLSLVFDGCP